MRCDSSRHRAPKQSHQESSSEDVKNEKGKSGLFIPLENKTTISNASQTPPPCIGKSHNSWNLGGLGSLVLGAGIESYRRLESRLWLHAGVWNASSRSKPFWKAFGQLALTTLGVLWRLPGSQIPLKVDFRR